MDAEAKHRHHIDTILNIDIVHFRDSHSAILTSKPNNCRHTQTISRRMAQRSASYHHKRGSHKKRGGIWYFLKGQGQVWRRLKVQEDTTDVRARGSWAIPVGAYFQFRNIGQEPLRFVTVTVPPWPGKDKALRVPNHWPTAPRITALNTNEG